MFNNKINFIITRLASYSILFPSTSECWEAIACNCSSISKYLFLIFDAKKKNEIIYSLNLRQKTLLMLFHSYQPDHLKACESLGQKLLSNQLLYQKK